MATPRNGNCDFLLGIVFLLLVAPSAAMCVGADGDGPVSVRLLRSTYGSADVLTAQEAEALLERLKKALAACSDDDLAWRIRYRLGVIYFKAGRMAEAQSVFERIAATSRAPDLIQACCLNMAGQTARLQGEDAKALAAFARVAALTERLLTGEGNDILPAVLRRLWCGALIGRAEICESRGDAPTAAAEYERLLHAETELTDDEELQSVVPPVRDRLSQSCLQRQDVSEYLNVTATLVAQYPDYWRTPMVDLERMCVRLLREIQPDLEYPQGALHAPERLIARMSGAEAARSASDILGHAAQLCEKYDGTPARRTMEYYHAWMLDAAGRRDRAFEAIARASKGDAAGPVPSVAGRSHADVLHRYAVIQHAVMLAESAHFVEALQLLATLPVDPNDQSHISQLTESVAKCIQTLKREVPANEVR
jgi:tetratricopeptide (TPR) repeat protein